MKTAWSLVLMSAIPAPVLSEPVLIQTASTVSQMEDDAVDGDPVRSKPTASFLNLRSTAFASAASKTNMVMSVSLKKLQVGVVSMDAEGQRSTGKKSSYYGSVKVGSPPQEFVVVYDTGSGNLIVPGKNCQDPACKAHSQFDTKLSETGKPTSCDGNHKANPTDKVTINFGTGTVTGECWRDNICVSTESCAMSELIVATHMSSNPFEWFHFDGVQGLALETMSQGTDFNLMSTLQDKLQKPLFSVFMSERDDEDSQIVFGGIKESHLASKMFWAPVERDWTGYWEVKIGDITLGNKRLKICENCNVAVDTGTSELAGPAHVILQLKKLVGDCTQKLGFVVGNHILNLEPSEYSRSGSVSFMSLDVPPPKGPLFILGIPFLQKFFTAYDAKRKRVGFAVAKHANQDSDTTDAAIVELPEE